MTDYKCGHNSKPVFMSNKNMETQMIRYHLWKTSVGFDGTHEKCFACWNRERLEKKQGEGRVMKLQAKIKAKYLDELLSGDKDAEYRQFESITLTDERGRSRVFDIVSVFRLQIPIAHKIMDNYPDVGWIRDKELIKLKLKPKKKQGGV